MSFLLAQVYLVSSGVFYSIFHTGFYTLLLSLFKFIPWYFTFFSFSIGNGAPFSKMSSGGYQCKEGLLISVCYLTSYCLAEFFIII